MSSSNQKANGSEQKPERKRRRRSAEEKRDSGSIAQAWNFRFETYRHQHCFQSRRLLGTEPFTLNSREHE